MQDRKTPLSGQPIEKEETLTRQRKTLTCHWTPVFWQYLAKIIAISDLADQHGGFLLKKSSHAILHTPLRSPFYLRGYNTPPPIETWPKGPPNLHTYLPHASVLAGDSFSLCSSELGLDWGGLTLAVWDGGCSPEFLLGRACDSLVMNHAVVRSPIPILNVARKKVSRAPT